MSSYIEEPISTLPGLGQVKAALLEKELDIKTIRDLIYHFPYRYIDKTIVRTIREAAANEDYALIEGVLGQFYVQGAGPKKRLTAILRDDSGSVELIWFQGQKWIQEIMIPGRRYSVYGKFQLFRGKASLVHPEMEAVNEEGISPSRHFDPVYSTTEALSKKGLDARGIRRLLGSVIRHLNETNIPENLSQDLLHSFQLPSRLMAIKTIHFPAEQGTLIKARNRLKFEELFFQQLSFLKMKLLRKKNLAGFPFTTVGKYFNEFYHEKMPFSLTEAQKKVVREIRKDMQEGRHMNRLLQGDVGSGKTVVALLTMLIAMDNGYQACLVAPTEILAQQHYDSLTAMVKGMGIRIGYLTGSVTGSRRKDLLRLLALGELHIIIGTHAVFEEPVTFHNLGLAITDEQHRFGVAQRAALWKKSAPYPPHVLVMTATPIPRTLALSLYGDLDISIIDELPPGRKPIETMWWSEGKRLKLIHFMKSQIAEGRQIYVVYPLIEESEKLDLLNLEEGMAALERDFPKPEYQLSIIHGKMAASTKDFEMQRFVKKETQIMVATTVIEVGVNVPNASVMVIENAERFGLSQLHQLRGRVGRGADQSYCILMTGNKVSEDAQVRLRTMCRTNDGFQIADVDLKLRGPGDMEGTRQSGLVGLKIANLREDGNILTAARAAAEKILDEDPDLLLPQHHCIKSHLLNTRELSATWSRIS